VSGSVTPVKKQDPAAAGAVEIEDGLNKSPAAKFPVSGSPYVAPRKKGADAPGLAEAAHLMPPASVMTRLILIMVWRKLIRNPNTYSSLIGLTWSLVSFRCKSYLSLASHGFSFPSKKAMALFLVATQTMHLGFIRTHTHEAVQF
jgi:hypothetical protein